ncbi:MAG: uL30 family ribosomal protein [Candidatus Anstonellales archaeon]
MLICAIRVRGIRNIKPKIRHTLEMLGLNKVNNAIIIKDNESLLKMLDVAKDYITYGPLNEENAIKLIEKVYLKYRKNEANGRDAKTILQEFLNSKNYRFPFTFRLRPPRKGYKSIKRPFSMGGALGKRAEIDSLVSRMF